MAEILESKENGTKNYIFNVDIVKDPRKILIGAIGGNIGLQKAAAVTLQLVVAPDAKIGETVLDADPISDRHVFWFSNPESIDVLIRKFKEAKRYLEKKEKKK